MFLSLSLKNVPLLLTLPVFLPHNTFLDARMSFFGFIHYFLALLCATTRHFLITLALFVVNSFLHLFSFSLSLPFSSSREICPPLGMLSKPPPIDTDSHSLRCCSGLTGPQGKENVNLLCNHSNKSCYVPFRIWIEVEWTDTWQREL